MRLCATGKAYEVQQLGVFTPHYTPLQQLSAGDVGVVVAYGRILTPRVLRYPEHGILD